MERLNKAQLMVVIREHVYHGMPISAQVVNKLIDRVRPSLLDSDVREIQQLTEIGEQRQIDQRRRNRAREYRIVRNYAI
jgi:hypothetical protein